MWKAISDNECDETVHDGHMMERFGEPEEVVGGAVYLAADASSFVRDRSRLSTVAGRRSEEPLRRGPRDGAVEPLLVYAEFATSIE